MVVYLYELTLSTPELLHLARSAGVVPYEIAHLRDLQGGGQPPDLVPPPLTVLTSLFVHGDAIHLLGNVWFLWLFGSRLEGFVGSARFLGLFFLSASVAAALQVS